MHDTTDRISKADHTKQCPHNPAKIREIARNEYFLIKKGLIDWNKLLLILIPFVISFFIYMASLSSRTVILEFNQKQQRDDFEKLRLDIVREVRIAIREERNQ